MNFVVAGNQDEIWLLYRVLRVLQQCTVRQNYAFVKVSCSVYMQTGPKVKDFFPEILVDHSSCFKCELTIEPCNESEMSSNSGRAELIYVRML